MWNFYIFLPIHHFVHRFQDVLKYAIVQFLSWNPTLTNQWFKIDIKSGHSTVTLTDRIEQQSATRLRIANRAFRFATPSFTSLSKHFYSRTVAENQHGVCFEFALAVYNIFVHHRAVCQRRHVHGGFENVWVTLVFPIFNVISFNFQCLTVPFHVVQCNHAS